MGDKEPQTPRDACGAAANEGWAMRCPRNGTAVSQQSPYLQWKGQGPVNAYSSEMVSRP